jgi:hypothetical protein
LMKLIQLWFTPTKLWSLQRWLQCPKNHFKPTSLQDMMHFQKNPQNKKLTFCCCYYYYWSNHDVNHDMFTSRQNYLGPFLKNLFCLIISWCLQTNWRWKKSKF